MTTSIIVLLDTLGRDPFAAANLNARVSAPNVDAPIRDALIGRDAGALARAFGETRTMWCWIAAPEDEPQPIDENRSAKSQQSSERMWCAIATPED